MCTGYFLLNQGQCRNFQTDTGKTFYCKNLSTSLSHRIFVSIGGECHQLQKKVASRFSFSLRNSIDNNKYYACKCTFIIFQQDMAHKGLTIPMWIQNIQCLSLTHWGRVTHICVGKLSIIGSDNGLSPDRRQAIIWTNAGILLIGTLGTNSMKF